MVIDDLSTEFFETVTRRRYVAGSYVKGTWVNGVSADSSITARVQNATPKQLETLREAERVKEAIVLFGDIDLRTADDENKIAADEVIRNGRTYRVESVETWDFLDLAHKKAIAAMRE
jgi:hypothetical protein